MVENIKTDICVIGGGSAGLVVASGAALFGVDVVLIEKGLMGGDCLNYGCIPSKSLIHTGKIFDNLNLLNRIGFSIEKPKMDFSLIKNYISNIINSIAPNDSEERFEGMGIRVVKEQARFLNHTQIITQNTLINAKKIVVCSGSSPSIPDLNGLESVPYYTNETIFQNEVNPDHLVVIGAGAIGVEIAQAYKNLSVKVSIIDSKNFLNNRDKEASEILKSILKGEGIDLYENCKVEKIRNIDEGKVVITLLENQTQLDIECSHLLVCTGRTPNVKGLDLDKAGIFYNEKGIKVNSRLRTSNKRVYAAGDVIGKNMFTHAASYEAGIVLRNILFKLPVKYKDYVPNIVYSSPEFASIGISEEEAYRRYKAINILRWPVSENDRAVTEGLSEGLIKIIVKKNGQILGVNILSSDAGDLIVPWILAIKKKINISVMASLIMPYPVLSEIGKRASGNFFLPKLTSKITQKIVKVMMKI